MPAGCTDTDPRSKAENAEDIEDANIEDTRDTDALTDSTENDLGTEIESDISRDAVDTIARETSDILEDETEPKTTCGNGTVESSEACDDGNRESGDYCSADCSKQTGRCGDGKLQDNETCDDGEISSGCDRMHDGGDGTCVPPDQCIEEYLLNDDGECIPETEKKHVHIRVDNFCKIYVKPEEITVPSNQTVKMHYHYHDTGESDYTIDVWNGGGAYGLEAGDTYTPTVKNCTTPGPADEFMDITIHQLGLNDENCPGHRFDIHCQ